MDIFQVSYYLSIIFGLITPIIAIRSIFKGEYKPQRITRLIFLILSLLFVGTLSELENGIAIALAFVGTFANIIIFTLSLKYGMGGYSREDILVFVLAMISLLVWKTTNNPALGLMFSLLTDFLGLLPTIVKSYKQPYTEAPLFYLSDTIAAFFSFIAVGSLVLTDIAYPMYLLLANGGLLALLVLRRRIFKFKA